MTRLCCTCMQIPPQQENWILSSCFCDTRWKVNTLYPEDLRVFIGIFLLVASLNHLRPAVTLYCDHLRTYRLIVESGWTLCKGTQWTCQHELAPLSTDQVPLPEKTILLHAGVSNMVWTTPFSLRFLRDFWPVYLHSTCGFVLAGGFCFLCGHAFFNLFFKVLILPGWFKLFAFKTMHNLKTHLILPLLSEKVNLFPEQSTVWSLLRNTCDSISWITEGSNISPFFIDTKIVNSCPCSCGNIP